MVLVAGMAWAPAMQGRRERSYRQYGRDRGRSSAPLQVTIRDTATMPPKAPIL